MFYEFPFENLLAVSVIRSGFLPVFLVILCISAMSLTLIISLYNDHMMVPLTMVALT